MKFRFISGTTISEKLSRTHGPRAVPRSHGDRMLVFNSRQRGAGRGEDGERSLLLQAAAGQHQGMRESRRSPRAGTSYFPCCRPGSPIAEGAGRRCRDRTRQALLRALGAPRDSPAQRSTTAPGASVGQGWAAFPPAFITGPGEGQPPRPGS